MTAFDFDQTTPRRGTRSYKWDEPEPADTIPMWVADMDFRTAPAITEALSRRVQHGIFGYTLVPDKYYSALTEWFGIRHAWHIDRSWVIYTQGVVPAISAVIKAIAMPGDKVIVQTPVYNCFFSSIRNNGCEVVESPLVYTDGSYTIDFDHLEQCAADPKAVALLLCNPHNPAGRVWTRQELLQINTICMRHGVRVIADEIHCELVYPPHRYTPFASASPDCLANSVTCNSPTKAFNIAGLQIANIVCPDSDLRRRIDRAININEVCDVNPFGIEALIAAYTEGAPWLDALTDYLHGNYTALCRFFAQRMPQIKITRLEGTYLVWADCRALGMDSDHITDSLMQQQHVLLNSGTMYGQAGEGFVRINIACPRSTMTEGLERMAAWADGITGVYQ